MLGSVVELKGLKYETVLEMLLLWYRCQQIFLLRARQQMFQAFAYTWSLLLLASSSPFFPTTL